MSMSEESRPATNGPALNCETAWRSPAPGAGTVDPIPVQFEGLSMFRVSLKPGKPDALRRNVESAYCPRSGTDRFPRTRRSDSWVCREIPAGHRQTVPLSGEKKVRTCRSWLGKVLSATVVDSPRRLQGLELVPFAAGKSGADEIRGVASKEFLDRITGPHRRHTPASAIKGTSCRNGTGVCLRCGR